MSKQLSRDLSRVVEIIKLPEHYGGLDQFREVVLKEAQYIPLLKYFKHTNAYTVLEEHFAKKREKTIFRFKASPDTGEITASTSYFIGHGWLIEGALPLKIYSKLEQENKHKEENKLYTIDVIGMLNEALLDPQNLAHLAGLIDIRTDEEPIQIAEREDLLTPFILITFIHLLRSIVARGLKRNYYSLTENLAHRVKGKILTTPTILQNHTTGNLLQTYCRYDQFGVDHGENQLLKCALNRARTLLSHYHLPKGLTDSLEAGIRFITPAFSNVSNRAPALLLQQQFQPHRLYQTYNDALPLARLILTMHSLSPEQHQSGKTLQMLPPYWIDMSKLYELYLFKKLRQAVQVEPSAVKYHYKTNYQELDFLLNYQGENVGTPLKMVIDAKYKPYYKTQEILKEDARQVAGYARLKSIYRIFNLPKNELIDALIIYPDQSAAPDLPPLNQWREEESSQYQGIYKVGIRLPVKVN